MPSQRGAMPGQEWHKYFLFFNDTATPEIYTLCLHDALPICLRLRVGVVAELLGRRDDPSPGLLRHTGLPVEREACRRDRYPGKPGDVAKADWPRWPAAVCRHGLPCRQGCAGLQKGPPGVRRTRRCQLPTTHLA